jgi:flavin reductase (DIM6/NTAB) family NADH-FMN oxidoreductase RutF
VGDFDDVSEVLDYPMFIVTTAYDGHAAGCLVGFATQTSIDPPRFLVGLSDMNRTHRVALKAPRLVVHVLDAQSTMHDAAAPAVRRGRHGARPRRLTGRITSSAARSARWRNDAYCTCRGS